MSTEMIPEVTIKNVVKMSFNDMLKGIKPYVLEQVPEGLIDSQNGVREADRLIGRFSNLYAYLIYLSSFVHSEATRMKLLGNRDEAEILMRKKTALYELGRAVRYKHEACSRMLTARLHEEDDENVFDTPDHGSRRGQEQQRRMTKWDAVTPMGKQKDK